MVEVKIVLALATAVFVATLSSSVQSSFLVGFTSIEQVHEVDGHTCTIKEELHQLDEKASILKREREKCKEMEQCYHQRSATIC